MTYSKAQWEEVIFACIEIDPITECWLYVGNLLKNGYVPAHRDHKKSWEIFRGERTDGLELDHLCEVKRCINPWHLEEVTHGENIRRRWRNSDSRSNFRPKQLTFEELRRAVDAL